MIPTYYVEILQLPISQRRKVVNFMHSMERRGCLDVTLKKVFSCPEAPLGLLAAGAPVEGPWRLIIH